MSHAGWRALVACVLVGVACAGRSPIPTPAAAPPRSDFVMVKPGVRLHYLDWGGSGDVVLLLPGLWGSAEIYSELAPGFTDRFRVVALSRRGHGCSDEPATGYEPDSLADDIRVVLDSLRIPRAHLVGHSLAGVELTAFAGRHPERVGKLVYLDAAYDRAHQRRLPPSPVRVPAFVPDMSSVDAHVASMRSSPYWAPVWSAPVEAQLRAVLIPAADGGVRAKPGSATLAAIRAGMYNEPPRYDLVRAPVLSIYARVDTVPALPPDTPPVLRDSAIAHHRAHVLAFEQASIDQLRRALPDAQIVELRGTHHHLFLQRRDEVVRIVREFLMK